MNYQTEQTVSVRNRKQIIWSNVKVHIIFSEQGEIENFIGKSHEYFLDPTDSHLADMDEAKRLLNVLLKPMWQGFSPKIIQEDPWLDRGWYQILDIENTDFFFGLFVGKGDLSLTKHLDTDSWQFSIELQNYPSIFKKIINPNLYHQQLKQLKKISTIIYDYLLKTIPYHRCCIDLSTNDRSIYKQYCSKDRPFQPNNIEDLPWSI